MLGLSLLFLSCVDPVNQWERKKSLPTDEEGFIVDGLKKAVDLKP